MSDYAQFEKRLAVLTTKHRKMARGYTAKIGEDGLIMVEPKRVRSPIRPRTIVLMGVGVFLFKALLLTSTGLATYENRIAALSSGTVFEQAAAWVMQPDVVSRYLAETFTKMIP
ncbi:hypothetical protein [uncultured Roseobacter sp.]|uniref:hypothetical protein n=1 Tax=uncultured Roseobacter sp. TaxID=114847 RepID=UPI002629FBE0|nr:hypothetical protein [uncultured Roseobacter sp.]